MINGKYYAIDAHCHIYPEKIAKLAVDHTDNFYSENSFVWNIGRKSEVTNELMEEIKNYIQEKIRASKNPHPSNFGK